MLRSQHLCGCLAFINWQRSQNDISGRPRQHGASYYFEMSQQWQNTLLHFSKKSLDIRADSLVPGNWLLQIISLDSRLMGRAENSLADSLVTWCWNCKSDFHKSFLQKGFEISQQTSSLQRVWNITADSLVPKSWRLQIISLKRAWQQTKVLEYHSSQVSGISQQTSSSKKCLEYHGRQLGGLKLASKYKY